MKVSNQEIRERSGMRTIDEQVLRIRRGKWLVRVLRMSWDKNPKIALTWAPVKRRRGRPIETWRRTINKERERLGFKSRGEAVVAV